MPRYTFRTLAEAIEIITADLTWLPINEAWQEEHGDSPRPTDTTAEGGAGELSRQQEALIPRVRACTTWRQLVALIKSEPEHIGDWLTKIPAPMRLQALN